MSKRERFGSAFLLVLAVAMAVSATGFATMAMSAPYVSPGTPIALAIGRGTLDPATAGWRSVAAGAFALAALALREVVALRGRVRLMGAGQ